MPHREAPPSELSSPFDRPWSVLNVVVGPPNRSTKGSQLHLRVFLREVVHIAIAIWTVTLASCVLVYAIATGHDPLHAFMMLFTPPTVANAAVWLARRKPG